MEYEKEYWDALMDLFHNEYGVAGLMGNLKAESGLIPYRKQGDFTSGYAASQAYTSGVDNGSISKETFVNDEVGYGVAQWTWNARKRTLYDFKTTHNLSIGSFELSIIMLKYELLESGGYKSVGDYLKTATSVRGASNKVLHDFEAPKDQSEEVEIARAAIGQQIYDKYSGSEPPEPPDPPTPTGSKRGMPVWMYLLK